MYCTVCKNGKLQQQKTAKKTPKTMSNISTVIYNFTYSLHAYAKCYFFLCPRDYWSRAGLDINACPISVKTDVEQVDLVLQLSNGTSEKIRNSQTCRYDRQIYFHWYKILGLLYKRALFDLQFVHNLFWLKLKWNARSKLFYCSLWWSSRTLTKLNSQSQKRFNERNYQYLRYKNKNHSGTDT